MHERLAWIIFAICAVGYLVLLPALPDADGTAEDVAWAMSLLVAAAALVALIVGLRAGHTRRRGRG